ncbi:MULTISPECIES: nucleoside deaminase [Shouchella]|uniref:Cytidine deaminase-like protein n=2 Tax=Bacillaceae TaxID=186817 RepID=A0A060LZF4_9BACI|nr:MULTISPECIES: nucleoside deaminase [Bacillaceae]AIC93204.1 cytidine deaminase-like protein [Shouchella lehensis G1]KQL55999.1 cytidine deaminase [Alkalicoccobacillus plakortidis]
MITSEDKAYLLQCIELAKKALENGDEPFGSLLVSAKGDILFEDHNHVSSGDQTQHPEFAIARWAAAHLTAEERKVATVYTSGEHCPMCAAAHGLVGLGRIVYVSSSKQLREWKKEIGLEPGNLHPLAIEDVVKSISVDGPDEELAEEVKRLHVLKHST